MKKPILTIDDLHVTFPSPRGPVYAVSGLSLDVHAGEFMGIVGESGSGKTTVALAALRLLAAGATVSGGVRFSDIELLTAPPSTLRQLRGQQIGYIPQDPLTALDPTFSVGEQIAETIRAHRSVSRRSARSEAMELMSRVGIPEPERRYGDPAHRLSGGMRQRITIAIAIANAPEIVIADEPTTALDVTIQAQILTLLAELAHESGTAMLLITHDLGVVAETCDRVAVMYAGTKVETGDAHEVFADPQHPYTRALLASIPSSADDRGGLPIIRGEVPSLREQATGCPFAPRCAERIARCDTRPSLDSIRPGWHVACWLASAQMHVRTRDRQHATGPAS